jgi:sigma-B regulation protein RsbU (phosphoserine phosphatase)
MEKPDSAAPSFGLPDEIPGLLTVIQELNAAPDLRSGLSRVAELLRGCVPYDNLSVLLLDDLGRELRYELAVGVPPEIAEHWRFGMGQGLVGTVAQTGRAVHVGDVHEDPRYIRAGDPVRSELVIPLISRGRTVGVLDIGSLQPHRFSEEDETFLSSLASFLASAIENAQIYRNLREQARTLSVLHEVSREISSILDRRQLLERVADMLKRLIDYDLFSVLLWCAETETLDPWVAFDRHGLAVGKGQCIRLGEGLCGTAAALRQSLRVPNVRLDPRYMTCNLDFATCSEMVVPMVFKDQLVGVLDLESLRYDAFTAQHEQLLSTLASSLAISLENARLYERLRQDEQRVREELVTARRIQEHLLPKTSPWIPGLQVGFGYEPAQDLGGDFYDFLTWGEGRLGVAVGDVAGKATAAALYGSFAVGMLREYSTHGGAFGPAQVLEDLGGWLKSLSVDRRFLAMIFAVYDSADRTLTLASSGLPYPWIVSNDQDGEPREILVQGTPLGVLKGRYEETVLRLQPGDVVAICSDGVEESRNPDDEALGSERIREVLRRSASGSAVEIAQALLDASERFSGRSEPSDDRTVVVLKVTG